MLERAAAVAANFHFLSLLSLFLLGCYVLLLLLALGLPTSILYFLTYTKYDTTYPLTSLLLYLGLVVGVGRYLLTSNYLLLLLTTVLGR